MTIVNPFPNDPERGGAFEQGYLAGYAEPDSDHFPPLEGELLDIFHQGEAAGRDDRSQEPSDEEPLPAEPNADFTHFESAPDGTLIPIPDAYPPDISIRDDAQITVSNRGNGFYVVIYNGPSDTAHNPGEIILEFLSEVAQTKLEHMLAEAAATGARGLIKFGGFGIGLLISIFTSSPILKETGFRGFLPDGRPVAYVVLTPQN
jgi:hypothetical protein